MNSKALTENAQEPARHWLNLLPQHTRAEQELDRIKRDLVQAQNEIGDRLAPPDAKAGESFHLWIRWPATGGTEVLLEVKCIRVVTKIQNMNGSEPFWPREFEVSIRWPNQIP